MAERVQSKTTSGMVEWLQMQRTVATHLTRGRDDLFVMVSFVSFGLFSFETNSGFTNTYGTTPSNTASSVKRFK